MQIVTSDELVVQEQMTCGSDGRRLPDNSASYGDTWSTQFSSVRFLW